MIRDWATETDFFISHHDETRNWCYLFQKQILTFYIYCKSDSPTEHHPHQSAPLCAPSPAAIDFSGGKANAADLLKLLSP